MKTIEERADTVIYEPKDGHSLKACEVVAFAEGYELGATEQKKIDIERACEWLENWANDARWYTIEESIEMLRKAMEK